MNGYKSKSTNDSWVKCEYGGELFLTNGSSLLDFNEDTLKRFTGPCEVPRRELEWIKQRLQNQPIIAKNHKARVQPTRANPREIIFQDS